MRRVNGSVRQQDHARCEAAHRKLKWAAVAAAPILAAGWANFTAAQQLTWDASGANPGAATDGSGAWNTTTGINWSDTVADSAWITGRTAVIGTGGTAGTITIDDASGTVSATG